MIVYIKQSKKIKFFYKILNILKIEKLEDKTIIYLPINEKSKTKKIQKVIQKLSEYLCNNNIKNVVLEQKLMENEVAKNILYSHNINILDGKKLSRFLVYNVVQRIYEYKNDKIEAGEITLLINDNDEINIETIMQLAKDVKRMNIITSNIKKFRKVVEYLYNELGILIKLSNNIKTNLKSSGLIVNIDFPEEIVNKLDIPNEAVILNIPQDININTKKFLGINIKSWQTEIPNKYKLEGFDDLSMYESNIYGKPISKIFNQIQNDDIKIGKLIGINGAINQKEFVKKI